MAGLNKAMLAKKLKDIAVIDTQTDCWNWPGNERENGYCRTTWRRKAWYTHRLSYYIFVGEIKKGYEICHKCDNRKCYNPSHLFMGTRRDNMQDAVKKDRQAKGEKLAVFHRGEKSNNSKLKEFEVLKIRDLAGKGIKTKEISKLFKVTPDNINRIKRRDIWKHI